MALWHVTVLVLFQGTTQHNATFMLILLAAALHAPSTAFLLYLLCCVMSYVKESNDVAFGIEKLSHPSAVRDCCFVLKV